MKQETEIRRDVELLRSSLPDLPEPVAEPFLILVCGLPGTGKSWISRRLAERLRLAVLEADALRKTLYPTPAYTADENGHLFMATHFLIEELLAGRISVLLDATNLIERNRQYLYSIAGKVNAKLAIVRTTAPRDVVRQRLRDRSEDPLNRNASDADWEVYRKMSARMDPIRWNHFVADTSKDVTGTIDKVVQEVDR